MIDLQLIVSCSARCLGMDLSGDCAYQIARQARGTLRIANYLLRRRRVHDFAEVLHSNGVINGKVAIQVLDMLNVDAEGFDYIDHKLLLAIIENIAPLQAECHSFAVLMVCMS